VDACNIVKAQWSNASWRSDQVGAMQNPNWENGSCSIIPDTTSCTQGSVPIYAVNAILPEHVQTTIRFVSRRNLRLIIKTTGHDYLGRSTAAESLLLWLHYMKNITLINQYASCTGETVSNAVRIGAGVQWDEVYAWLAPYNLTAIGGASGSVGAVGGYLQGGGHGPLTRWKGLAADNVLEFDVVTADGQRQTVNACKNTDLFWALRGGGGGTFAIVLSVVLRTFSSPSILVTYYNFGASNEDRYAFLSVILFD
jgi:FAD/FMN-containing dehydrogenase